MNKDILLFQLTPLWKFLPKNQMLLSGLLLPDTLWELLDFKKK